MDIWRIPNAIQYLYLSITDDYCHVLCPAVTKPTTVVDYCIVNSPLGKLLHLPPKSDCYSSTKPQQTHEKADVKMSNNNNNNNSQTTTTTTTTKSTTTQAVSFMAFRANIKKRVQRSLQLPSSNNNNNHNNSSNKQNDSSIHPNYWCIFEEEKVASSTPPPPRGKQQQQQQQKKPTKQQSQSKLQPDEYTFMQMRKDCYKHNVDVLMDKMAEIRRRNKGDETVKEVEKFILNHFNEWNREQNNPHSNRLFWWLSTAVAIVHGDSNELNDPFKMFEERMEEEEASQTNTLVLHMPESAQCKSISNLIKYILEVYLEYGKVRYPTFEMIIEWYQEKQLEATTTSSTTTSSNNNNNNVAIIFVWDDIDTVSPQVLNHWLRLCSEQYKSIPLYNVLRVNKVKAASILQSIFIHNISERLNVQTFKTHSSTSLLFYKILNQLFLKKSNVTYVRPGYHLFKYMFDHFHQKSLSIKDFQHQLKYMLQQFYHEEPLSFIPALLLRFPIGSNSQKMCLNHLLPYHKRRIYMQSHMKGNYNNKLIGIGEEDKKFIQDWNETIATSVYGHFLILPHVLNLIERLYRILRLNERDVISSTINNYHSLLIMLKQEQENNSSGNGIFGNTIDGEEEEEDEEVLLLRIRIYMSILENASSDLVKRNSYVKEILKLLTSSPMTRDVLNEVLYTCMHLIYDLNHNEQALKGQMNEEEKILKEIFIELNDNRTSTAAALVVVDETNSDMNDEEEDNVDGEDEEIKKEDEQQEKEKLMNHTSPVKRDSDGGIVPFSLTPTASHSSTSKKRRTSNITQPSITSTPIVMDDDHVMCDDNENEASESTTKAVDVCNTSTTSPSSSPKLSNNKRKALQKKQQRQAYLLMKANRDHEARLARIEKRIQERIQCKESQCAHCFTRVDQEVETRDWIACDQCDQWYHVDCLTHSSARFAIDDSKLLNGEPFVCDSCVPLVCIYCEDTSAGEYVYCEDCKQKYHINCANAARKHMRGVPKIDTNQRRFLCVKCAECCSMCGTDMDQVTSKCKCHQCYQQFCSSCLPKGDAENLNKKKVCCAACVRYHEALALRPRNNRKRKNKKQKQKQQQKGEEVEKELSGFALDKCESLLGTFRRLPESKYFNQPVDIHVLNLADYYTIVENPMDLGTVEQRLYLGYYTNTESFAQDIRLIWNNCILYNSDPQSEYYLAARKLRKLFEQEYGDMRAEINYQEEQKKRQQTYDQSKLYCVCKKEYDHGNMIICKECCNWFHPRCVGLSLEQFTKLSIFFCEECQKVTGKKIEFRTESNTGGGGSGNSSRRRRRSSAIFNTTTTTTTNQAVASQQQQHNSSSSTESITSTPKKSRRARRRERNFFAASQTQSASSMLLVSQQEQQALIKATDQLKHFLIKFMSDYFTSVRSICLDRLFYFDVQDVDKFFQHVTCTAQLDLMKCITESIADCDINDNEQQTEDDEELVHLRRDLAIGYATYKNCGETSKQFHMLEWLNQFASHLNGSKEDPMIQARFSLVVRSLMHVGYVKGVSNQPWILEKQLL